MAVCWVILRGQQIYTVIQAVHSLLYIVAKCHFFSVVTWKDIIKYLQKCEGCTHVCEILYIYRYIYISAVKVNALTQIHFNGTNFFNVRLTQRVFSVWPVAQPVVGEMEMHSVANLATLQTPLATFFPSKKHPNLVSENLRYCRARSCSPSARAHLSLSLSLCASALFSARTPLSHSPCICPVQCAHTSLSLTLSLSVHLPCSARAHLSLTQSLSLCASALFSARTPLSLCASALFSARTPLSHSLSLCICPVQRAHTSLSLTLSLSVCLLCSARAHLSLSLSVSAQFLFSEPRRGAAL